MKHLIVSNETLKSFLKENKTSRLDKSTKLYTYSGFRHKVFEELFDRLYPNTEYTIKKHDFGKTFSNYRDTIGYQIKFETDSDNLYRIDLIPVKS